MTPTGRSASNTVDGGGARYLLSSHDGFGLGHLRRNSRIAAALLAADATATVTLVTGVASAPKWCQHPRIEIVAVPPLLKDGSGAYRSVAGAFEVAVAERARAFSVAVDRVRPHAILVDRHPYGTAGELRHGLETARRSGAALVLGLRDVLDEPAAVAGELAGAGWAGVTELFDEVLVYGNKVICDHRAEYGLPFDPHYCGWVAHNEPLQPRIDPDLVLVAAGGGGDGADVVRLGLDLIRNTPQRRGLIIAGPYGDRVAALEAAEARGIAHRVQVEGHSERMDHWLARAGAVVHMAGYNSTVESLVSGHRPILVPRRNPRREQAIRAARLTHLGVADVVDAGAEASEVAWLLDRPRRLAPGALAAAGIDIDGAAVAASRLAALVGTFRAAPAAYGVAAV